MPSLKLTNVSKSFGKTKVLENFSLELADGEFMVLLGPSGCGKSTCLRLIAGLEELDGGEIYLGTRKVNNLKPKDRNVAMVFQNYSLYPHMTVAKNLAFPLSVAGVKKDTIRLRVEETAKLIRLVDYLKHKPGQLSGGQRQRVALGRAIIRNPDLFLLDEPLSNLDADLRIKMRKEIVKIQKRMNCTAVYVTHDQTEALTMGDRIALLDKGKIVQVDTPLNIYKKPSSIFIAQFIGTPKINLIDSVVEESTMPPFNIAVPTNVRRGGYKKITIGIRPDAIKFDRDGYYSGMVISSEFVGDSYIVVLQYKQHYLTVSQVADYIVNETPVNFSVNTNSILCFDPQDGRLID